MGVSNTTENNTLDYVFRGVGTNPLATQFLALHTADPGEAGSLVAEVSGGSYARVAITPSTFWNPASGGMISNAAAQEFPQATGSWGTVTHFSLCSASSGGNVLASGALSAGVAFGSGDTPRFSAGQLVFTLD
jgi:hypothetical protein